MDEREIENVESVQVEGGWVLTEAVEKSVVSQILELHLPEYLRANTRTVQEEGEVK